MSESKTEYNDNSIDDMTADNDCQINTGELPELFDEFSIEDFITNLNDWD